MISAPPPSEITQQSSLCSGSAIIRELTTSSAVIGSRYIAFGLSPANSRTPAAISPSCSIVVPSFVHVSLCDEPRVTFLRGVGQEARHALENHGKSREPAPNVLQVW